MGATRRSNAKLVAAVAEELPKGSDGEQEKTRRTCLHSQLHKTKLCMYHLKGQCQYGSECAFAHSCAELQDTPDLSKTRLCVNFIEGPGCRDPNCTFAHGEEELRSTDMFYKKTLCMWNEKGKCRNGNQCRFAHGVGELRASAAANLVVQDMHMSTGKSWSAAGRRARKATGSSRDSTSVARSSAGSSNDESINTEPMKIQPSGHFVDPFLGEGMPGLQDETIAAQLQQLRQNITALNMQANQVKQQMNFADMEEPYMDMTQYMYAEDDAMMNFMCMGMPPYGLEWYPDMDDANARDADTDARNAMAMTLPPGLPERDFEWINELKVTRALGA